MNDRKYRLHLQTYILIFLLLLIASCGGGSSSTGEDGAPFSPFDDAVISGSVLNPRLPAGEIFIGDEISGPRILDLATGRYRLLEGYDWEERSAENFLLEFAAHVSPDRQEILETVNNCTPSQGLIGAGDCIVFRDLAGQETGRIEFPPSAGFGLGGPAKLSHDGQLVAVVADFDNTVFFGK